MTTPPPAPVTFITAADYIARRAEGVACVDEEGSS